MPLRYSPLGLVLLIAVSGVVEQTSESVQVCLASAADYSAVYPTNVLPATSKGIAVVFRVTKGKFKKMTEKIFAVDAGTAIPPNTLLASTDDVVGPVNGAGFFESSGERPVPPGKYRVDILADGAQWKTTQFSVVPAAEPKIARQDFHSTTERDFLPGVGIVREIYVVATKNGELQNRVERVLTSVR